MESLRWIRGAVPVATLALMGAAALARPSLLEAADPPWDPPSCPAATGAPAIVVPAWYRLDGVVDETGTLSGHRLTVGALGEPGRAIPLPPESFATGPVEGRVLVGADDGSRSRLELLNVGRGCRTVVADEAAVVRSALVTPDAAAVVEHRVDRTSRADLGIWRVPAAGGPATRIVAGIAPDARYGPTFSTELRWAPDGRLAVTACGESRCRTRLVAVASGRATAFGPTGPVLGVTSDGALIANAGCGGFPCAIVRREPGRDAVVLVERAGLATMAGDRVVFEAGPGRLAVIDALTGSLSRLDEADGLTPVATGSHARAGASRADDAALLVLGSRLDGRSVRVLPADAVTPTRPTELVR